MGPSERGPSKMGRVERAVKEWSERKGQIREGRFIQADPRGANAISRAEVGSIREGRAEGTEPMRPGRRSGAEWAESE